MLKGKLKRGGGGLICEGELNKGFTVDFLTAREQKLGARVHWALLENSHDIAGVIYCENALLYCPIVPVKHTVKF